MTAADGSRRDRLSIAARTAGLALLGSTGLGEAKDGDLQRALLEVGCINAKVTEQPGTGKAMVYRANCFGSQHKLVEVVCIAGRCTANLPMSEERDRLGAIEPAHFTRNHCVIPDKPR